MVQDVPGADLEVVPAVLNMRARAVVLHWAWPVWTISTCTPSSTAESL